jgi:hypothetical protein
VYVVVVAVVGGVLDVVVTAVVNQPHYVRLVDDNDD